MTFIFICEQLFLVAFITQFGIKSERFSVTTYTQKQIYE